MSDRDYDRMYTPVSSREYDCIATWDRTVAARGFQTIMAGRGVKK
jgi:hypothetical protein